MNLGKLNKGNDIATTKISLSNEDPSILSRSRREEMMHRNYLYKKNKRSIDY